MSWSVVRSLTLLAAILAPRAAHSIGMVSLEGGSANATVNRTNDGRCENLAGSIGVLSAHARDFQFALDLKARRLDTGSLGVTRKALTQFGLDFGVRYLPRRPLAWITDKLALRFTASGAGGFGIGEGGQDLVTDMSAGLALSGNDPVGLMIEGLYRPTSQRLSYDRTGALGASPIKTTIVVDPWAGARLTFFW